MSDVSAAFLKFDNDNDDVKANVIPSYLALNGTVCIQVFSALTRRFIRSCSSQILVTLSLYYDSPNPPPGLFDEFLTISALSSNVHEGTFADYINSVSLDALSGLRYVSTSSFVNIN